MGLYDVVYEWFSNYVFVGDSIPSSSFAVGGVTLDLASWLNHTATIVVLACACFLLFGLVVWFGKFIGGCITKVGR